MALLKVILFSIVVATCYANSKPKVIITNPTVPQIAIDLLKEKCEIIKTDDYSRKAILEKISGVDAILWATHNKLDKEILEAAGPHVKTIATMSAGFNQIDLNELKERNITLANTPDVLSDAVADTAILLALSASRRLTEGRKAIEGGTWDVGSQQWLLGKDIKNATVGIVGLGRIGREILKRLNGFKVKQVLYTHKEHEENNKLGAKFVPSLDNLLESSDFIFISVTLNNKTRSLFNEDAFNKMKKKPVLINTSRGAVIDQPALIKALKEGKIFAAGLDVMTPEPLPTSHELLSLPNVVLLPHIGSATVDTRNAMAELTAKNILNGLEGKELLTPVKF